MKILFLIGATSRIRHFDRTILILADRGHTVHLAGRPRKGEIRRPANMEHPRVAIVANPVTRDDAWGEIVEPVRAARDYVRYLSPRFANAARLARRAAEFAPPRFVQLCERLPWLKRNWHLLEWVLAFVEELTPSSKNFEAFLKAERPDVVLVTPLVTFESYQTDYVKAAHRLGMPIAFLPFSWDNLSNKGLMRVQPDRILVWNETQRCEAVELHGSRADSVVITGAQRFDDFFAMKPSRSRTEFCKSVGLDPARPYIAYLCSSALGGPNEVDFVRTWVQEIRNSNDHALRTCGILVRPHPANGEQWSGADLSDLAGVVVSNSGKRNSDQDLYDSLCYASTVVGLNTSAMLEAAILGKSVHTVLTPGFDEGQVGTLHFNYLIKTNGGLLVVARDFDEHRQQLASALDAASNRNGRLAKPLAWLTSWVAPSRPTSASSERSLRFVEGFLRPHGLDKPVAPVLAREIEHLTDIKKSPQHPPLWHYPLRWALLVSLRALLNPSRPTAFSTSSTSQFSLRPISAAFEHLQQDSRPIVVGPWLDDVGAEVLYWIPFLRWAAAQYRLQPERFLVISHGGAHSLYSSLASRYVDADELFERGELQALLRQTIPQSKQNPKQLAIAPLDQEIIRRALKAAGLPDAHTLHPLVMFRLLRRFIADGAPDRIRGVSVYVPIDVPQTHAIAQRLPDDYVAVSFHFNPAFPDTSENRQFIGHVLRELASREQIILLDGAGTGTALAAAAGLAGNRSLLIVDAASDDRPIYLQVQLLARAKAFVGSYGGLSVLAPFCGIAASAYYSEKVPGHEIQLARRVFRGDDLGSLDVLKTREFAATQLRFVDALTSEKMAGVP